ncbi:MAG: hypothetical protein PF636_02970 [Actinomycetota bacterium]|jgi:hypothetical protein|nr:hypothetical protein [Actinomycetota bacterium]
MDTAASIINELTDSAQTDEEALNDAVIIGLLASSDEDSLAELAVWLKENATTLAPLVTRAAAEKPGLSGEASCAVLDALLLKPLADEDVTVRLMGECLRVIAARITASLSEDAPGADNLHDDPLVSSTVAVVTAGRRAHLSETAVSYLAKAGSGGSLVLARSFDTLRDSLKLHVLRRLKPADVWVLGGNVVASLGNSISTLIEGLEGKPLRIAVKFLEGLDPEAHSESSDIDPAEPLAVGAHVFHASWGAGSVVKTGKGTIKVDFGSAGTRTLMRKFATLRHA